MNSRATVYVIDSEEDVLYLYRGILRDLDVTLKVFKTAGEFFNDYRPAACECVICNFCIPDTGGLALQRELASRGICPPILFVASNPDLASVVAAIKEGAMDFLVAPLERHSFQEKVRAALERSRNLHLVRVESAARQARIDLLTEKEREIAIRVVAGDTSREISEDLGISVRTVENHRARIAEKLQIGSAVELVHLLLGEELCTSDLSRAAVPTFGGGPVRSDTLHPI